ncbi:MAG: extracellular solute-binding protein, partial [Spirochaetota bacterium]
MKTIALTIFLSLLLFNCAKESKPKDAASEFTVWIPGDRGEYGFYYDMFDNFKQYKEAKGESFNYTIEQQPWKDYWTKLPLEVNNGRGPDIFLSHMAYVDIVMPISRELEFSSDLLNQFYVTDLFTGPNGKPYFIPTLFVSKIMYANKDLYPDYQNYPQTWEELGQAASRLSNTEKGIIGFDYSYHIIWDLGYQNGFTLTDTNGNARFDGTRKGLEYI